MLPVTEKFTKICAFRTVHVSLFILLYCWINSCWTKVDLLGVQFGKIKAYILSAETVILCGVFAFYAFLLNPTQILLYLLYVNWQFLL